MKNKYYYMKLMIAYTHYDLLQKYYEYNISLYVGSSNIQSVLVLK